jgi:hypothetical protein
MCVFVNQAEQILISLGALFFWHGYATLFKGFLCRLTVASGLLILMTRPHASANRQMLRSCGLRVVRIPRR